MNSRIAELEKRVMFSAIEAAFWASAGGAITVAALLQSGFVAAVGCGVFSLVVMGSGMTLLWSDFKVLQWEKEWYNSAIKERLQWERGEAMARADRNAAEADDLAARVKSLKEALRAHHHWHLNQDRDENAWGINPVEAYSESGLCEMTVAALSDNPSKENGNDTSGSGHNPTGD